MCATSTGGACFGIATRAPGTCTGPLRVCSSLKLTFTPAPSCQLMTRFHSTLTARRLQQSLLGLVGQRVLLHRAHRALQRHVNGHRRVRPVAAGLHDGGGADDARVLAGLLHPERHTVPRAHRFPRVAQRLLFALSTSTCSTSLASCSSSAL